MYNFSQFYAYNFQFINIKFSFLTNIKNSLICHNTKILIFLNIYSNWLKPLNLIQTIPSYLQLVFCRKDGVWSILSVPDVTVKLSIIFILNTNFNSYWMMNQFIELSLISWLKSLREKFLCITEFHLLSNGSLQSWKLLLTLTFLLLQADLFLFKKTCFASLLSK